MYQSVQVTAKPEAHQSLGKLGLVSRDIDNPVREQSEPHRYVRAQLVSAPRPRALASLS